MCLFRDDIRGDKITNTFMTKTGFRFTFKGAGVTFSNSNIVSDLGIV